MNKTNRLKDIMNIERPIEIFDMGKDIKKDGDRVRVKFKIIPYVYNISKTIVMEKMNVVKLTERHADNQKSYFAYVLITEHSTNKSVIGKILPVRLPNIFIRQFNGNENVCLTPVNSTEFQMVMTGKHVQINEAEYIIFRKYDIDILEKSPVTYEGKTYTDAENKEDAKFFADAMKKVQDERFVELEREFDHIDLIEKKKKDAEEQKEIIELAKNLENFDQFMIDSINNSTELNDHQKEMYKGFLKNNKK